MLSVSDEEEFLKEVYDVGIGLERCSNDLFEISLFNFGENSSSDGWFFSNMKVVILLYIRSNRAICHVN